jgi:hypothetical protein
MATIKTHTGVTDLTELVQTFSKGFEENQKLKDYAERLSSEIDEL